MSSLKTEQYQLHQWEPGDSVLREEFNENFAKLDVSTRLFFGSYTGDGAAERLISLPITPKAVLVVGASGYMQASSGPYGGLAIAGSPVTNSANGGGAVAIEITDSGFVTHNGVSVNANSSGWLYHYIALA